MHLFILIYFLHGGFHTFISLAWGTFWILIMQHLKFLILGDFCIIIIIIFCSAFSMLRHIRIQWYTHKIKGLPSHRITPLMNLTKRNWIWVFCREKSWKNTCLDRINQFDLGFLSNWLFQMILSENSHYFFKPSCIVLTW